MTNKIIALDCDGVLLDWHGGFIDWVEQKYGWYVNDDHPCDTYDMNSWFEKRQGKSMTKEDFVTLVKEFNGFPRCLYPLDEAVKSVKGFHDLGYEVVVVTSFGSCPLNCEFREDYLNILFDGCISDTIILGLGECKEDTLKKLDPVLFVEDNAGHAEKAAALGIDTFLIKYPFNSGLEDVDNITYVNDLKEILVFLVLKELEGLKFETPEEKEWFDSLSKSA